MIRYFLSSLLLICSLSAESLLDLTKSVQNLGPDNFRLSMTLKGAIATDGEGRDLKLVVDVNEGKAGKGFGSAPSWNKGKHSAQILEYTSEEGRITGVISVTLQPDNWVPVDKQPIDLKVDFEVLTQSIFAQGEKPYDEAYWSDPQKRQGILATAQGSYSLQSQKLKATKGEASGDLRLPNAPGKWSLGYPDEGGILMGFDMGQKRRNWNLMKNSRFVFPEGKNLSDHGGLSFRISTDAPRDDAEVSVFLKEKDGSWYHAPAAVPLASKNNRAKIRFVDLEEAEWVSPDGGTSFMDEDFTLDLDSVQAIAIGVINPLGIGPVQFRVDAIELLGKEKAAADVEVVVSGQPFSVNDHPFIPAGLFGGYASDLPQRYRPGCQRHLATLPSGHASDRYGFAYIGRSQVLKGEELARSLIGETALVGDLAKLANPKALQSLRKSIVDIKKRPKKAKKTRIRLADQTRKIFNAFLGKEKLIAHLPLDAGAKSKLDAFDGAAILKGRMAVDLAFPDHIKALTSYHEPSEAFIINCQGDRTQPATYLNNDGWKEHMERIAVEFATKAKALDYRAHTEFWNEPYLNWQKGTNFNPKYYRTDLAGEDKPVIVRRKDGSTDDVIPHFKWGKDKKGNWKPYDPTAFTYWSARGQEFIYNEMFSVYAKKLKETDPKVMVIGGWGMKWHEDHWAAWELLAKPTIDKNWKFMDGFHEHHYMGDTMDMAGSYEVLTTYGMSHYDKWLYSYNTETSDLLDIPAVGVVNTPEKVKGAKEFRVGTYNIRDILYLCAVTPDKAMARTVIHWSHTPKGSDMCYATLSDLRGQLIAGESSDPGVWVVSSVDGTDPNAMPADGAQKLVVAIWNDNRDGRNIDIDLRPPVGTRFVAGQYEAHVPDQNKDNFGVDFNRQSIEVSSNGTKVKVQLKGRRLWKLSIPLEGEADRSRLTHHRQYFSKLHLAKVGRGQTVSTDIEIPEADLKKAKGAYLRLVLERLAQGEGTLSLNGKTLQLPETLHRENGNRVVDLPVETVQLKGSNALQFSLADPKQSGYRVDAASLFLIQE